MSINANIKLETKLIGDIEGNFFIPSYQRGYRWDKEQIVRLLEDIITSGREKVYYLQPIVLKKLNDGSFELIDGQQRLTTLYLIASYLNNFSMGFLPGPKYTLEYQTREKSAEYLKNIAKQRNKEENIDFWFMGNAYETISKWGEAHGRDVLTELNYLLANCVKVIWYEVDDSEDAIKLFTRLNIGKIPLTSSELIKAMFLSDAEKSNISSRQEEIALQWDLMEKELHNDALWYFLTNDTYDKLQTRIDLVMDLISGKKENCLDKYYTYFFFDALKKLAVTGSVKDLASNDNFSKDVFLEEIIHAENTKGHFDMLDIWQEIQHTFLVLKDWFGNHDFYHKIGYLIACRAKTLKEIYAMSLHKTKKEFMVALDDAIRESIKLPKKHGFPEKSYAELSYENTSDYRYISKFLLLFNVESVRQLEAKTRRFPFAKFKVNGSSKMVWSLEHIHAQHSQGMRKEEEWKQWLKYHVPSVKAVGGSEELLQNMKMLIDKNKLAREEFEAVQRIVIDCLSEKGSDEYKHSLANMALLGRDANSALNNSTFDVKRNIIIEMDKAGEYIPLCTKMVFLKYYTPTEYNQVHFWGKEDRNAYIKAMNETLANYLEQPIEI